MTGFALRSTVYTVQYNLLLSVTQREYHEKVKTTVFG